jgi:hypothetical protein
MLFLLIGYWIFSKAPAGLYLVPPAGRGRDRDVDDKTKALQALAIRASADS